MRCYHHQSTTNRHGVPPPRPHDSLPLSMSTQLENPFANTVIKLPRTTVAKKPSAACHHLLPL
ncbi:hypothetical protein Hanom_Chr01g00088591 [Helianthus anomalus]